MTNGVAATITGIVIEAKTASFRDDDNQLQTYGKIQLLVPDMSGEFKAIENVKVKLESFGWLPDIAAQKNKEVTLSLDLNTFKGKTSLYLSKPLKSLSKAS